MRGLRRRPARRVTTRPIRTPDVFSERVHTMARLGIPVVLGLVYGYWAAANRRHGGPVTGWNILFGFVTAFVFIVLCLAVARFAPRLKRELHSMTKSGFAGAALGFLYNQSGASILRSVALGLVVAGGVFGVFFYRYYTREDAEGNRIR
jgi:K+-transporting ATPase A subunit